MRCNDNVSAVRRRGVNIEDAYTSETHQKAMLSLAPMLSLLRVILARLVMLSPWLASSCALAAIVAYVASIQRRRIQRLERRERVLQSSYVKPRMRRRSQRWTMMRT